MYTLTTTRQSIVCVERRFPTLQTELHIKWVISTSILSSLTLLIFIERKLGKQRREGFISTDQILYSFKLTCRY